ncbi:MAG: phospholipid carrier-dependent glycosyltransferase [Oligoflexia bacterium]
MSWVETKASSWIVTTLLAVGALALFSFNLEFPTKLNFDEFHYVPSAKQFLALSENQNYEHPPLGKELIAVGIGLFGDHPVGWRIMSVFFGVLTLLGVHRLALAVFSSAQAALLTSVLTLFNSLLYVQSRIAMLDTFMAAFLVWGAAFVLEGWQNWNTQPTQNAGSQGFILGGACLGFAAATKWFALMPIAAMWFFFLLKKPSSRPPLKRLVLSLGWVPLLAYFLTFAPFLFITKSDGGSYGAWEILTSMQWRMWDGQLRVISPHSYGSHWWQWPLMLRPMWYAFDPENDPGAAVRGVALIGNPVVLWGGVAALGWTAWDWFKTRRPAAALIVSAWGVCTFSWLLIPRKLSFFYYYYPAALCLGFALTYWIRYAVPTQSRIWTGSALATTTIALFFYFFPILAALPIGPNEFMKWMWLRSWI